MWSNFVLMFCAVALAAGWQTKANETSVGHGLQVIRITPGPNDKSKFELDMTALAELLDREDVAGYPVAMVSIAGAFRGGKSFLLNFFLRYLHAPRSKQISGEWLGTGSEPLKGFHWRGGSQRDTSGIYLWSEPFDITMEPSGEKVVVLLMDTQGTFDSQSSNRDSTTVFALSTLLSSVQIYNLFRNIQENDLQNLHLFTEYGQAAAASTGGKAFQELKFLVRDWQNDFEYPYGYTGGNAYLANKLRIKPGDLKELREVREHIHSCFDNITCFLMPHPGMKVAKGRFQGIINDIEEDFLNSLLELVPSLFDPTDLTPKTIGGHQLKGRDLKMIFQAFADAFNSDALPPILTIGEGAKAAALMLASNAAREEYDKLMKEIDKDTRSCNSATIQATHDAARTAALRVFDGRIVLGTKEKSDVVRMQLVQEWFATITRFVDITRHDLRTKFLGSFNYNNGIKLRAARAAAARQYNATLCAQSGVTFKQQLCLSPPDLTRAHALALAAALSAFDSQRRLRPNETDDERLTLQQELGKEKENLRIMNEYNNDEAVQKAGALYLTLMSAPPEMSNMGELQTRHESSANSALASLANSRSKPATQASDVYKDRLLKDINKNYEDIKNNKAQTNKLALSEAVQAYTEYVRSEWSPPDGCFNPQEIDNLLQEAQQAAKRKFREKSVELERDSYENQLNQEIHDKQNRLKQTNHYNNMEAVDLAFHEYTRAMDRQQGNTNVFKEFMSQFDVKEEHKLATTHAIQTFFEKRLRSKTCSGDQYLDSLNEKINKMLKETYASFWVFVLKAFLSSVKNFFEDIVSTLTFGLVSLKHE